MDPQPLADTADFSMTSGQAKSGSGIPSANVEVQVGGMSHQGKVRKNNEDYYLISRFGRSLETLLTNLPAEFTPPSHQEIGYGLLVADGMGGPAAGEVASRTAIQGLMQLVLDTPDWMLSLDRPFGDVAMARMMDRFREIDRMLVEQGRQNPAFTGMGTTLTLACNLGLDLLVCHVGDSRAYRIHAGQMKQLTRDMTVAQDLVDAGVLNAAGKLASRMRHVLTQSLGTGNVKVDIKLHALEDGDRVMLCSDGLTEMVVESEIAEVLRTFAVPAEACHEMVERALQNGGRDNVTVVVADYHVK